jgi:hypothetical protein
VASLSWFFLHHLSAAKARACCLSRINREVTQKRTRRKEKCEGDHDISETGFDTPRNLAHKHNSPTLLNPTLKISVLPLYKAHFNPMRTVFTFLLLATLATGLHAQKLEGKVVDKATQKPIPQCHVVNKRTLKGTLSGEEGNFKLNISLGDTIVFSNVAYKYFYFIYQDSATAIADVLVEMEEQNYLLHEVSIFAYELTSNDDKEIVLKQPSTPKTEELSDGRIVEANIGNPAEYLYNLFGSKPRQLRQLAQLKADDAYREKLKQNNNRSIVTELTGLSQSELEAFMFYCKYSSVRMQTLNDYDFLLSVQDCYHQYVKEKELNEFLNQFD